MADVDKVQLWLVLLRGWAAKEEGAAEEEGGRRRGRERTHAPDEAGEEKAAEGLA